MTDHAVTDDHSEPHGENGSQSGFSLTEFVRNLETLPPRVVERTGARAILDWENRGQPTSLVDAQGERQDDCSGT